MKTLHWLLLLVAAAAAQAGNVSTLDRLLLSNREYSYLGFVVATSACTAGCVD